MLEVVLMLKGGPDDTATLTVGRTRDAAVLRTVRDQLIAEAEGELDLWSDLDPTFAEVKSVEVSHLRDLLARLMPRVGLAAFQGGGNG